MRSARAVRAAVLLALPTACGGSPEEPPVSLRQGVVDLEIGEPDGVGPRTFGRITGLTRLADGSILVLDGDAAEARVFGEDGEFRFAFGRSGAGPGELDGACCAGVDARGRVWIRDGGNARYNVYEVGDTAAVYRFSVRMGHGDINFQAPITFDAAGRLIDIGHRPDSDGLALVRLHTDSAGTIADSTRVPATPLDSMGVRAVTRSTAAGNVVWFLYPPWGPLELLAHGPGGHYAKAISSTYRIAWYDHGGALLRVIEEAEPTGPEATAEERERAQARIDSDAERFGLGAMDRFSVPGHKQPLHALAFDQLGRLWVGLTPARGAPREADVRNADGALAFRARWPADVDLLPAGFLGDALALGIRRDSLGVESVVRLRWESAPG